MENELGAVSRDYAFALPMLPLLKELASGQQGLLGDRGLTAGRRYIAEYPEAHRLP